MRGFACVLAAVLLSLTAGCAPYGPRPVSPRPEPRVTTVAAPSDELDRKIDSLQVLLEKGDVTQSDRTIIRQLLETYKELRRSPSPPALSESDYQDLCRSLYRTVSLLEENYRQKLAHRTQSYSEVIHIYEQTRKEVRDNYLYGNFRAVIDQCLELQKEFGPDALTPDVGLLFALSLAEEGMLEEAVSIGEGILRKNEVDPDLFYLKVKVAQWHLGLGQRSRAIRTYNQLTDHMDDQEDLVGELKREIADTPKDFLSGTDTAAPRDQDVSMDGSLESVLNEVEDLIRNREFDKAKILLIRHRIGTSDREVLEALELAMKRVEGAEDEILEQPKRELAPESDELRVARQLIDEERYEEAVARLESMEPGQEVEQDVQDLKSQAIEKLIQHERNRAARLFLAARETNDPEQKEAYLQSSRNILKRLLSQYPSSNLNNKIKSNINIVEEELKRVKNR